MQKFKGYQCSLCGTTYHTDEVTYNCPKDSGNLNIILDIDTIRRAYGDAGFPTVGEPSLWRYLKLLPVNDPGEWDTPLRAAGQTPIYSPPRIKQTLGLRRYWLKDESRNPTASFKDRASALVAARAREIGANIVVTASTGNAGAALAGMCAAINQKAVIFAPRSAPPAKIAQLLIYGAEVLLVEGSYDDAFDLSIQASQEFGWYCRNTGYNPFTAEGKKTAAFEIWDWHRQTKPGFPLDQLRIFVSVGDGNIISGIHKGFKDLHAIGWIDSIPKIFGVQAQGSAAIANAYQTNSEKIIPVQAQTIADSISVDLPRDGVRALRAAVETGGGYIVVSDDEILSALSGLGKAGIFSEPAGAASQAGLKKATDIGLVCPDDPVLVINTGSGLKDIKAAMQAAGQAKVIEPTIEAVKRVIEL